MFLNGKLTSGFSWPFVPLSHRVLDRARLCLVTDLKLAKNKRGPNQMINGLGLGHYLRAPATLLPCWLGLCEGASQYAILGHPHLLALLPNRSSVNLPTWYNGIFHSIERIHSELDRHKLTPVLKLERDFLWCCILVSTPRCWCWQVNPETALSPCCF